MFVVEHDALDRVDSAGRNESRVVDEDKALGGTLSGEDLIGVDIDRRAGVQVSRVDAELARFAVDRALDGARERHSDTSLAAESASCPLLRWARTRTCRSVLDVCLALERSPRAFGA